MSRYLITKSQPNTCPLVLLTANTLKDWLKNQDKTVKTWVKEHGFEAKSEQTLALTDKAGQIERILVGVDDPLGVYSLSFLPETLSPLSTESFKIEGAMGKKDASKAALGWALACYQFTPYKKESGKDLPKLVWPAAADKKFVQAAVNSTYLVRDLINTPPNALAPKDLAREARTLARKHNATCTVISGKALVGKNYPAIYEVGKGSSREPCLIDIKWGSKRHPRLTLVGKGITFDTGGYDLKPSSAMINMKKDMGGAALVLGLASMIISLKLKVRLRVLIAAAENMIAGNAYRPSDVIKTRKGLTVEVGNTDAEGRLVIADALAEASRENPKMLIDFATLTGAARAATGPDISALFSNDDSLAQELQKISLDVEDPLWHQPLWQPYAEFLKSPVADTNSTGSTGRAGHVTAALFLQKFIDESVPWIHIDTNAWYESGKPGRPRGGEAMGMRAVFNLIEKKFG